MDPLKQEGPTRRDGPVDRLMRDAEVVDGTWPGILCGNQIDPGRTTTSKKSQFRRDLRSPSSDRRRRFRPRWTRPRQPARSMRAAGFCRLYGSASAPVAHGRAGSKSSRSRSCPARADQSVTMDGNVACRGAASVMPRPPHLRHQRSREQPTHVSLHVIASSGRAVPLAPHLPLPTDPVRARGALPSPHAPPDPAPARVVRRGRRVGAPAAGDRAAGRRPRRQRRGGEPAGARAGAQLGRLREHRRRRCGPSGSRSRPGPCCCSGRRRWPLAVALLAALHMFVAGVTMPEVMGQVSLQIVYFVALLSRRRLGARPPRDGDRRQLDRALHVRLDHLAVRARLDGAGVAGRRGLHRAHRDLPADPGGHRDHPADQRDLLRRRDRRRRGLVARRPPARPARRTRRSPSPARPAGCASRRSSTSGCGSPASCTTWSPTASPRWASRPVRRDGSSTATPTPRVRPSRTSRRPPATRSPRCAACSAPCARATARAQDASGTRTTDAGVGDLPAPGRRGRRPGPRVSLDVVEEQDGAAGAAAARHRARGLPHRAGGPDQRPPALHRRHRLGRRAGRRGSPRAYAEVEVVDNGRPRHGTSGSGLGQLGIRERAATHDGQVDIGPRVTGGYRVRVRYPLGTP